MAIRAPDGANKDTKTQTQIQKHKQNNKYTNSKYENRKVKDTKTQAQIQKHKQNNKNTNSKYKNRKVGGGYFSFASGWRGLLVIGKESAFPENHDEELGDGATNLRQRSCGMANQGKELGMEANKWKHYWFS